MPRHSGRCAHRERPRPASLHCGPRLRWLFTLCILGAVGLVRQSTAHSVSPGSTDIDTLVEANGAATFHAKLVKDPGSSFGMKMYQRSQDYDQSSPGDKLKASSATFCVVSGVEPGSPADTAGVRVGDQILEVNGHAVAKRGLSDVIRFLRGGGDTSELLLWRRAALRPMSSTEEPSRVVSVVAYNRPDYLARSLARLAQCTGIEDYTVMFFVEPVDSEVIALAHNFSAARRSIVHVNQVQFGFPHNIRQAVEVGFTQGDFVILLEDDILLSEDSLIYFEWAQKAYARDQDVFTVTAYGDIGHSPNAEPLPAADRGLVSRRAHFTPWGWGTWVDRFEEMAPIYTGWDAQMNFFFPHATKGPVYSLYGRGLRGSRTEIAPLVSRANNIGMEGGIHARIFSPEKMKQMQYLYQNVAVGQAPAQGFSEATPERMKALCAACDEYACGKDTTQSICGILDKETTEAASAGKPTSTPVSESRKGGEF